MVSDVSYITSRRFVLTRLLLILSLAFKFRSVVCTIEVISLGDLRQQADSRLFGYDVVLSQKVAVFSSPGDNNNVGTVFLASIGSDNIDAKIPGSDIFTSLFGYNVDTDVNGRFVFASYFQPKQALELDLSNGPFLNNLDAIGNVFVQNVIDPEASYAEIAPFGSPLPRQADFRGFGWSTSFDRAGNKATVLIGAPGSSTFDAASVVTGNVFVASLDPSGRWNVDDALPIPLQYSNSRCGFSVSYQTFQEGSLEVAVVGCPLQDNNGAALVFMKSTDKFTWELIHVLAPTDKTPDPGCGNFGTSVLIDRNTIAVSCPTAFDTDSAKVFIYHVDTSSFLNRVRIHQVISDSGGSPNFGYSMAMDETALIICSPGALNNVSEPIPPFTSPETNPNGRCFLYLRSTSDLAGEFTRSTTFESGLNVKFDGFGYSVDIRLRSATNGALAYDFIIGSLGDYATGGVPAGGIQWGTITQPLPPTGTGGGINPTIEGVVRDSILDTNYIFFIEFIITALAIYIATS